MSRPAIRHLIGAMSGTSADGVDAALVAIEGHGVSMRGRLIAHQHHPYPAELKRRIVAVRTGASVCLHELGELARQISFAHLPAIQPLLHLLGDKPLEAVAAHGQTIYHQPPVTMQILDAPLLAHLCACRVIDDFRRADCAVGGQGAPLVPFADYLLFADAHESRLLLNIGGIANLTWLPSRGGLNAVRAFDCGPGNCVSDELMRRADPAGPGFDQGGALAAGGNVHPGLLQLLGEDDFFKIAGPRSTDGPYMMRLFDQALARLNSNPPLNLQDQLACACAWSAQAIAAGALQLAGPGPLSLIVAGGGALNATMMKRLAGQLPQTRIGTSDELGVPAAAREAMAFALLGAATLDGCAANLPAVTGATGPVILGRITPAPIGRSDCW